jgi:hypothetical protein
MEKKRFSVLLVLIFALVIGSCSSTQFSNSGGNSMPANLVGIWRYSNSAGGVLLEIDTNGKGTFKMVDSNGNDRNSYPIVTDGNGQIKISQINARCSAVTDVVVNGKYLGEKLTITEFMDDPISFHKTQPSKNISLGETSWSNPRGLDVVYVFNDDGSFKIETNPTVEALNTRWNADTAGTFTFDGIDVTLNYPNGKALKWTETPNGGIAVGLEETNFQSISILGNHFYLGYAEFVLSE